MYYVYVIKSQKTNKLYFGFSNNLKRRLQEHNAGKSNYTRRFRPWDLIYYEAYLIEKDARKREVFLKSGSGKRYLDKQLKYYFIISPRKKKD